MNRRNFIAGTGLALTSVAGCVSVSSDPETSTSDTNDNDDSDGGSKDTSLLEITEHELVRDTENEQVGVEGKAVAQKALSYAEITATFIDNDDAHVDSRVVVTENLDEGQTWKWDIYSGEQGEKAANIVDYKLEKRTEE